MPDDIYSKVDKYSLFFVVLVKSRGGGGRIYHMGKIKLSNNYNYIISVDNLLSAWKEFLCGKKLRKDVQEFERNLMNNILSLHRDLKNKTYKHSSYYAFNISDLKPRNIHKASVRDRLLHHALYRILYPFFDRTFIFDSYSCRLNKGTHKAINRFREFSYKVSKNNSKTCWVLKCDIRKFFANINHNILLNILAEYIPDKDILWLLREIVISFNTKPNTGLPLGNLISQLFVNIYMNKFDQFIKHKLKVKYYIRYADDFVIIDSNQEYLNNLIEPIANFLNIELKLDLHPQKTEIRKFEQGIDFLGYVILPHYAILRTKTKNRMFRKIKDNKEKLNRGLITKDTFNQSLQSYYGIIGHCSGYNLNQEIDSVVKMRKV
jgi:RNA-directed DNA polymerase